MLAALSRKHIARRAGLGAARRSARGSTMAALPGNYQPIVNVTVVGAAVWMDGLKPPTSS